MSSRLAILWLGLALTASGLSCTPPVSGDGNPPSPDDRFAVDAGRDFDAGEGDEVILSATAEGGLQPYYFRWSIERRPTGADDVTLSDDVAAEVRTSPLTVQGSYVFRVVLEDSADHDAYDFVTVSVGPPGTGNVEPIAVRIEGPEELEPGELGSLRAVVNASSNADLVYQWETVTDHDVTFETPDERRTLFTVNTNGVVVVRCTVTDEAADAAGSAEFTIEVGIAGALAVTVEGPARAEVNAPVEVTAVPENAVGDVTFEWTLIDGEAQLENADQATVRALPTAQGRLALEVRVTDPERDQTATAEYVVTVSAASLPPLMLSTNGPEILRVGSNGLLSVEIQEDADFDSVEHRWEIISGDATLDNPTAAETNVISSNGETVQVRVTVTATEGDDIRTGTSDLFVVTYEGDRPEVVFTITGFGQFVFELRPDVAPITSANLLRYVDDRFYDGLVIHRVVEDFVIQGGGFGVAEDGEFEPAEARGPIANEAGNGLSNVRGTVSMAQFSGEPESATSQWFVNLVDNTADGEVDLDVQDFAVFATVSEGLDVVDEIAGVEVASRFGLENVPVENVVMESVRRR